ncbi:MAG: shikimate dehydrogenase [Planctomycetaceae bacterium]|nr:shikimate dehydrogenase [Planctomycetaceae bacterium]
MVSIYYTEATLKFLKLNTQAQQREAVVQGRSLSPYRLRYKVEKHNNLIKMICVTIACGSHARMVSEQRKLASEGIQLVELRLDFLRREPDLHRLLSAKPGAVIVTARRKQDGGMWNESEPKRLALLRSAIVSEPEFVDLEVDIAGEVGRFGKTRRIISYHDFAQMPNDLDKLFSEMELKDPDIIKIAVTPKSVDDMFRFMKFVSEKNRVAKETGDKLSGNGNGIRVIGICMGELGKATRILAKRFGMPFTYATFSRERIIAPGILVYNELLGLYHYEQTDNESAVYGIIANPIGHSLSPLIHNRSYIEQKINAVYVPFQLDSSDVYCFLERAVEFGICGLSVTIPHKVVAVDRLTKMETAVDKIGACNTIVFKNNERIGYNTDYMAAVSSIETALGGDVKNEIGILQSKSAMVLGAGGAGMALVYGLKKRGANVTVTDANNERAKELSIQLGCDTVQWEDRYKINPEIIANCTPVGMHPNIDETPFDHEKLFAGMLVFDAVYNPENTLLIKSAKERGCKVVSGIEMFVGQACLQFKLFTGEKASATFIRKIIKDAIATAK